MSRLREGPISWAQHPHLERHARQRTRAGEMGWLRRVVDVPFKADVPEVEAALHAVIRRHEALRSTFALDRWGRSSQVVWAPDDRPLTFSLPPQARGGAHVIGEAAPYDPARDWPVRYAMGFSEGGNLRIFVTATHAAADYHGLRVLCDDILGALRAPGGVIVGTPAELQPVDIAEFERSPQGRNGNDRAIGHWISHRDEFAACHERLWGQRRGIGGRQLSATVAFADLRERVDAVVEESRVPASAVMISAVSRAFSMLVGWDVTCFDLVVANRHLPRSGHAVCTLSQRGLLVLPEPTSLGLGEYSKACLPSILAAARSAHYNIEDLEMAMARKGSDQLLRQRLFTVNIIKSDRSLTGRELAETARTEIRISSMNKLEKDVREARHYAYAHLFCFLHPNAIGLVLYTHPELLGESRVEEFVSLIRAVMND